MAAAMPPAQMISVRPIAVRREGRDVIIGEESETDDRAVEATIAEFIRRRGVTRCPTACVLPTHGTVPAQDRAALAEHAEMRERLRRNRAARQNRFFPLVVHQLAAPPVAEAIASALADPAIDRPTSGEDAV
jgi:hypothetical protein